MSLLVVGSIAIDVVHTPTESRPDALGGSAAYFAYAASYFAPVRLVSVIGEDFPDEYMQLFQDRDNVDSRGVRRAAGETFRWKGRYSQDMNERETLEVHLNVFGDFDPDIPEDFRDSLYVFLANGSPVVQRKVLHQVKEPKLVVADTMDLWIETARDELLELLKQIDGLVLNDQEVLMLTEANTVIEAGYQVLEMGPKFVIVKKGEHGAMLFSETGTLSMPAYPTAKLVDPTGAGDSFAGGLLGYLSSVDSLDRKVFKRGMGYGTVTASLNVEDFSLNRFLETSREDIEVRFDHYREMLRIE